MNDEPPSAPGRRRAEVVDPPGVAVPTGAVAGSVRRAMPIAATFLLVAVAASWLDHSLVGLVTAIGMFSVVALLVLKGLSVSHPHVRFGPANQVTLGRAGIACLLAGALPAGGAPTWQLAVLATAAAALDGVDGWLARRTRLASPFGARFDMEIDALLIAVLSLLAWRLDRAGAWILAAGAMRYLFVAAGSTWPWLAAPLPPSRRRQTICAFQVTMLVVCLVPILPQSVAVACAALGLAALAMSFTTDVARLWQARHAAAAVAVVVRSPDSPR
jgi:phosphatidylglycerophosphate synthase